MRAAVAFAAGMLLALSPSAARGQAGSCELVEARSGTRMQSGGFAVVNISGPLRVECRGGTVIRADSAVLYEATSEVHLYRNVDYQDPTRRLTSTYATYSSALGRLYATENVVFTDVTRGSTLRGPELEYYRAMEGRPQAQMIATGRPHLTIMPKPGQGSTSEAFQVDGDRVTGVGENHFSASGRVVIRRSDLDATAEEAIHDADAGTLNLRGNAEVRGERFDLSGEVIDVSLPQNRVETVNSRVNARLVSERLRVDGPEIGLFFEDDLLQRLVTRRAEGERSLVSATGFLMEADSLEALLPGQVLERVTAIGGAEGETVDTAGRVATAEEAGRVRKLREERQGGDRLAGDRDWVSGDTIIGFFEPLDSTARMAAADPEGEVELRRVTARGAARSLYRVREEREGQPPPERPALNYLAGEFIELTMRDEELDVAKVEGLQRGIYLDPVAPARAREGADSPTRAEAPPAAVSGLTDPGSRASP